MTDFAIGAATWPPKPVWFSRTTATATRGRFAGAKQMNQDVYRPLTPVSAVPVLPATWMPGICAAVPVPLWTAPTIIDVSSCEVRLLIARASLRG